MIEEEVKEIAEIYKNIIPLEMTAEDNEKFQSAVDCHICSKKLCNNNTIPFKKEPIHQSCLPDKYKGDKEFSLNGVMDNDDWCNYYKKSNCAICKGLLTGETVKDHDHLTGKFRGAAHNQCNLQYQLPKFLPVIFHNLSGYDSHLFIKQLGKSHGSINCIPYNEEKYISFSKTIELDDDDDDKKKNKIEIRYIDSFEFMASSIDSLSKNPSREQFREMNKVFEGDTDLLIREGVYPYDYMDSFDKFNETELLNYIVKKYGQKQKLLYTDTDSLAYEIKTEDFYQDISNDVEEKFDTSNYAKNHPSGIKTGCNKKVIGKMKDECSGKQILEFVGLRAKMYSYRMNEKKEKIAKGVKKNVIKEDISFDDYYECLIERLNPKYRKMNLIRSHNHEIYSETVNKVALSADDDKRFIGEDGILTFAYGHHML